MFFFIALIIGVLGASLILFWDNKESNIETSGKLITFGICSVIYTLITWLIVWAGLPSIAYPLFGWYFGLTLIWWSISAIVACSMKEEWSHVSWLPISGILILLGFCMGGVRCVNSNKYASLIGEIDEKTQKHWSQDIQPLDQTKIRLVPKELAISLARTSLSKDGATLGSQFPLAEDYITLQKINDDYWYLIPLDFKKWTVWTKTKEVPAYVKMSAVDPFAKPILVTDKKMKYMPNAYFGNYLKRILYKDFYNKILDDYSFEENDKGDVFWVITVLKPTISYWGKVVEGVVVVNPESGEYKFISKEDLEKNPEYSWIDRATPAEIAQKYVHYWGQLKDGWWNLFWTHINLLEAESPTMNYSSDSRCIFVMPVTSTNENDQAMTGLMYCDSRTGKFTYYTTSGGATEEAILQAVNSQYGYKNWYASHQIVYENVYGKLSALVPVLGQNGNYQGLAIVENENKRVAFGSTPQESLVEFQKIIMSGGGQISTEMANNTIDYIGIVSRIGWDISTSGKQYYLYLKQFNNSFMISSDSPSELALTQQGDSVMIKFINSDQVSVPTLYFKNITLKLRYSKNEESVIQQTTQRQEETQLKKDAEDVRDRIKNMSDEDLQKLMDSKK